MLRLWKRALEVVKEVFTAQSATDKEERCSLKVRKIYLSLSFFSCSTPRCLKHNCSQGIGLASQISSVRG